MMLETTLTLNEETVADVRELIQINIDSYNGFKQAAEHTADTPLSLLFNELAAQRLGQAVALQKLIIRDDEDSISEGSVVGRIHRGIMSWKHAFGGGSASVLREAERGEDYIKAKYEAALARSTGTSVSELLNEQYADVQETHDQVHRLRRYLAGDFGRNRLNFHSSKRTS